MQNDDIKNQNKIIIVGSPNVGKSVIFNDITGRYATVYIRRLKSL